MDLRREILVYSRACEQLLSMNGGLNDEERVLLEYYVNELIWKILSGHPTMQPRDTESLDARPRGI